MQLTSKQLEYVREARHRWNIAEGAVRSGKSWLATAYTIPDRVVSLQGKQGINLLLGVSLGNIERNVLVPMRDRFGDALVGTIKGSQNTCTLFGETVYCLGAEKRSQVAKLKGAEVKFCYCDELADINPEVFQMLKSRLSLDYSECHAACNPESPLHWLKRFIDTPGLDIYDQRYTIDDNPFLPESYVTELKREYAGTVYYDRFILGRWKLAEGLVYPFEADQITEHVEPQPGELVYIGIDYGITNPFAAVMFVVRHGVAHLVAEKVWDSRKTGSRKTDSELYSMLAGWLEGKNVDCICIDPSASSFIEEIERHGLYEVRGADNSVIEGIQDVSIAFNAQRLKISPDCSTVMQELGTYCWDETRTDGKDHVIKENDHAMDAMRYVVRTALHDLLPCLSW